MINNKNVMILFLIAVVALPFLAQETDAVLSGWSGYFEVTSNSALIYGNNTDYPYGYNLSQAPTTFWNETSTTGTDIVVTTNTSDTILDREIESFNKTGNAGILWFKNSTVNGTAFTYRVYAGNAGASFSNNVTTWNSNYGAVWHMYDLNTSAINDSTINGNIGYKRAANEPSECYGVIRFCQQFDGTDDNITVRNSATINSTFANLDFTISFILNTTSTATDQAILYKPDATQGNNLLYFNTPNATRIKWYHGNLVDAQAVDSVANDLNNGRPRAIKLKRNSTIISIYVDGVISGTRTRTAGTASDGMLEIADNPFGNVWNGTLDEFRVSSAAETDDWIRTDYHNQINMTSGFWTTGAWTPASVAPLVTITSPTNTTYYTSNSFNFTFKADDDTSPTYNITGNLTYPNGTITTIYQNTSYLDNTFVTQLFTLPVAGQYNFTVIARDNNNTNGTTTVLFTIGLFRLVSQYETFPYETNTSNYTAFLETNFHLLTNITGKLIWNGTDQGTIQYRTVNATHTILTQNVTLPLLTTNATLLNHSWNMTATYTNATTFTNLTANQTQTAIFAYYLAANSLSESSINPVEGDSLGIFFNITNILQLATISANATYNGTNVSQMSSVFYGYGKFNVTITVPNISGTNATAIINATGWVTFGSRMRTLQSEDDTITVHKIILTNCSTITNTLTMNFFLKDEETDATVNGTIEMTHNVSNGAVVRSYYFTFSNVTNATVCLNPAFATFNLYSIVQYYAPSYTTRFYFLNQSISNVVSNISLYLLPNSLSDLVIIFVRDLNNQPLAGKIVKAERYFVGTGTYKTVAQCITADTTGTCATYLRANDPLYRFIVQEGTDVLLSTSLFQIVPTSFESITSNPPYPVVLSLATAIDTLFFKIGDISAGCSLNQTSTVLSCQINDASGLSSTYNFTVYRKTGVADAVVCNTVTSSSALTFTCTLGTLTGNYFHYTITRPYTQPNNIVTIQLIHSGVYDFRTGLGISWGELGAFLFLLLVGTLFFANIFSPAAAIGASVVGVIVAASIGWITITYPTMITFIVVGLIMIWLTRN